MHLNAYKSISHIPLFLIIWDDDCWKRRETLKQLYETQKPLAVWKRDADNSLVAFVFLFFLLFISYIFFPSIKRNHDSYLLTGVLLLQSFLRIVILTVTFLQNFPSSLPAKWALIEKYQLKILNISETRTFLNVLCSEKTLRRKYPIHHCTLAIHCIAFKTVLLHALKYLSPYISNNSYKQL